MELGRKRTKIENVKEEKQREEKKETEERVRIKDGKREGYRDREAGMC